jgi:hypothetical protein
VLNGSIYRNTVQALCSRRGSLLKNQFLIKNLIGREEIRCLKLMLIDYIFSDGNSGTYADWIVFRSKLFASE